MLGNNKVSRRDFLKTTGAIGAALASGSLNSVIALGNTTVSFWSSTAAENKDTRNAVQSIIKGFEKENPSISIDLELVSYDVRQQKLTTVVEAGNPPDLAEAGTLGLKYALQDRAVNLKPYFMDDKELWNDVHPAVKEVIYIKDEDLVWGAPAKAFISKWTGRKDLLMEHNWDYQLINDWSDFLEACQAVTSPVDRRWGFALYGTRMDLEQYWAFLRNFASEPGEDLIMKKTEKGWESNLLNPTTKGATRFYVDLLRKFKVAHPSSPGMSDEEATTVLLGKGQIVMATSPGARRYWINFPDLYQVGNEKIISWDWPVLTEKLGEEFGDRYPELKSKAGVRGSHMWAYEQGQVVFNDEKADAVWKFLKYWYKPENAHKIAKSYGIAPMISLSALEQVSEAKGYQQIPVAAAKFARKYSNNIKSTAWPIPEANEIRWNIVNANVARAIAGDFSSDKALEKAHQEINQLLQG